QQGFAVGNDPRRLGISAEPASPIAFPGDTFLTSAQTFPSPASRRQSAGQLPNNRRLTRSADSKITDADHETSERAFAENSLAIEIKPELHQPVVDKRERVKDPAQD